LPWLLHFVDGQDAGEQLYFMAEVGEDDRAGLEVVSMKMH